MKKQKGTPSTQKVRRDVRGGKRGNGHEMQKAKRKVRRPDPKQIRAGQPDPTVTGVSGLVEFGAFTRQLGIPKELSAKFDGMKNGPLVVYPMSAQIQLLCDANIAGEGRVFGIESLAADPLFVLLAGGSVPSIDVLYDDLARFDDKTLDLLEHYMSEQTTRRLKAHKFKRIHVDIDTTVETVFGTQEGAVAGYNPRYHGRPSYHPMVARVAEVEGVVGAQLRHGDRGFGSEDVPTIVTWLKRVRDAVGPHCVIVVRVDAAGDCTELLVALENLGVHYHIKAKLSQDLASEIALHTKWTTVDSDAFNEPSRQVATVCFKRKEWQSQHLPVRVVAVRTKDRDNGKQIYLWNDLEYTVQAYLTNDWLSPEDDIALLYNARAGIEPLIAELKGAFGIGKVPSQSFHANHAAFLIKLLAYNLFRWFVSDRYPRIAFWRTEWLRRVIILRPGRIIRSSGRRRTLRTTPVYVHTSIPVSVPMLR